ncbi:HD-GYP domain-containing protein [Ornithinibacillus halophilus]|uniref:HDIG domain-containing protein n=1 Tax=Ornithinibacillus halophilus TaxID=930117 RepID=A0A1M5G1B0_9BACI|nr:HD domain-containing phosphohydrolase [Ornithinibacillus halophilus]SHF97580.1 HDIG domain-containing protein [Ornithinibacillus halophilus]
MLQERTPESLFEDIAQDNLVLKEFKHHSIRVMYLTTILAKKLNIFDEDLKVAALLHDIGKMGLSRDILLKPGKLTSLEKLIVESHSHVGNVIIRKELEKPRAAGFVRDHHENWDGTGYPRGLAGEDISLQGRILRVCDSFDAMTYDMRSYQETKMTHQEAIKELRRCSWRQFDGDVVEVFVDLIQTIQLPDLWYNEENLENLLKQI